MKCLAELTETQDKTLQQLSINHKHRHIRTIDQEAPNPWQVDHPMRLFDLLTYSPALNMIEIVWKQAKHRCRRFVTWAKGIIDAEIASLHGAYCTKFQTNFS